MQANTQRALFWMKQLGDEFEYVATSRLQEKFKIMLLMVYVDIFSQIWWEFIKEKPVRGTQKERFSSWCDGFVFSKANDHFEKHNGEFNLLDGNTFYTIRNSLLHFGGLPDLEGKPVFISSYTREEFLKRYSSKIGSTEVLVLCPKVLFVAVAIAISATIKKIIDEVNDGDKQSEILLKISNRVEKESALPIIVNADDT